MTAGRTALAPFLLLLAASAAESADMQDGHCGGQADKNFICGPANAEDLVRVPGTDWVLASRMANPADRQGMFYLLDAGDHSWRKLSIDEIPAAQDKALYPDCPDRPTSATLRGHGIALDEQGGTLKLLAINHGGRESVEVFGVTANGSTEPSLTWQGCVVAPQGAQLNSVVPLPGGGFAATKFFDMASKSWGEDLFAGQDTGEVLSAANPEVWGAGDEFHPVGVYAQGNQWNLYYIPNGVPLARKLGVGIGEAPDRFVQSTGLNDSTVPAWGPVSVILSGPQSVLVTNPEGVDGPLNFYRFDAANSTSVQLQDSYDLPDCTQASVLYDESSRRWSMSCRGQSAENYYTRTAITP